MATDPTNEEIAEALEKKAMELVEFGLVVSGRSIDQFNETELECVKLGITAGIGAFVKFKLEDM